MYLLTSALFVIYSLATQCDAMPYSGLKMPSNCTGEYMCFDKHQQYPDSVVEDLLNGLNELLVESQSADVGHRYGSDGNECKTETYMKPIYQIIDENDDMRFVVQAKEKFEQIIRIEKCREPGPITREQTHLTGLTVDNYDLSCVQCTLDYEFLVLSLDGSRLETAKMSGGVPVCCSCHRG